MVNHVITMMNLGLQWWIISIFPMSMHNRKNKTQQFDCIFYPLRINKKLHHFQQWGVFVVGVDFEELYRLEVGHFHLRDLLFCVPSFLQAVVGSYQVL